jgi:hypothetical protein
VRQIQRSTSLYHERYKRLSITLSTIVVKSAKSPGLPVGVKIIQKIDLIRAFLILTNAGKVEQDNPVAAFVG